MRDGLDGVYEQEDLGRHKTKGKTTTQSLHGCGSVYYEYYHEDLYDSQRN